MIDACIVPKRLAMHEAEAACEQWRALVEYDGCRLLMYVAEVQKSKLLVPQTRVKNSLPP
jgi:hypothetical protein